jgi:hypothetical protein
MTEIGHISKEKAIFRNIFMANHGRGQKRDALASHEVMHSQATFMTNWVA